MQDPQETTLTKASIRKVALSIAASLFGCQSFYLALCLHRSDGTDLTMPISQDVMGSFGESAATSLRDAAQRCLDPDMTLPSNMSAAPV
jgi:hypothetical protein